MPIKSTANHKRSWTGPRYKLEKLSAAPLFLDIQGDQSLFKK